MPNRPKVLDLAKMSNYAYENQAINGAIPGWRCAHTYTSSNDFFAKNYIGSVNGMDAAVFAIRGTDSARDGVVSDAQFFLGVSPEQFKTTIEAFDLFIQANMGIGQLFLTGHSLGGGLASMLSAYHGLPVVTFNAPGAVRSYVSFKSSGICNGVISNFPAMSGVCTAARQFIRGDINENQMLNVRASFDAVSMGTGEAFGQTVNVSVPTHFDFGIVDALIPARAVSSALGQGVAMISTQHSMDNIVAAVRHSGEALFARHGW